MFAVGDFWWEFFQKNFLVGGSDENGGRAAKVPPVYRIMFWGKS